jgi:hypothetical protein
MNGHRCSTTTGANGGSGAFMISESHRDHLSGNDTVATLFEILAMSV